MKLGSYLAGMSTPDRNLTLRQFGFPTNHQAAGESSYEYAIQELESAEDGALLELHSHLYPDDAPIENVSDDGLRGPWEAGAFRLFLSHTSDNRQRAGVLREALTPWGVDTFVAHDAIEPTREWQDEIERALRTCDALCALLTADFAESRWCDQEVGFAFARSILILPLKVEADPHGFIGKYQALSIPQGATYSAVADLLYTALAKNSLTAEAMAPVVVRRFEGSHGFDAARAAFALLREIPRLAWSATMIEQVERAVKENDQIYYGNLPGGRPISEAANELIREVRGEPEVPAKDDDILF